MPTFRHGKGAAFKIDDSGATLRDISNVLEEVGVPRSSDAAETTTFGDSDKDYIAGLRDATITLSGRFDATVDGYLAGILGQEATVSWEWGPEGTTAGRVKYSGEAILTSYEVTSPVGDVVGFSAELQNSGAITRGVWP